MIPDLRDLHSKSLSEVVFKTMETKVGSLVTNTALEINIFKKGTFVFTRNTELPTNAA